MLTGPVVLAFSNPTANTECTPEEVVRATDGGGLMATGSSFADVEWKGRSIETSQCNNLYVFPGVGLGVLVSKASSRMVPSAQEAEGLLLPGMEDIRRVSATVAQAVAREARDSRLGRLLDAATLEKVVAKARWDPRFSPYRPGPVGGPRSPAATAGAPC